MYHINRVRRRFKQSIDHISIRLEDVMYTDASEIVRSGDEISVISVNFNTLHFTKLMLLTLVDKIGSDVNKVVIVDNGSTDGSYEFLKRLSEVATNVFTVRTSFWQRHHAGGLRCGIRQIREIEKSEPLENRTGYYLICDNDIIFFREDLISNIRQRMSQTNAKGIGQVQYINAEPYLHPSCLLIERAAYHYPQIHPFINDGAPARFLLRSMARAGMHLEDFPIRSDNYIVHRGRGSIRGIQEHRPNHEYATVEANAHFHGNLNGQAMWEATEAHYQDLLDPGNEDECIEYMIAKL